LFYAIPLLYWICSNVIDIDDNDSTIQHSDGSTTLTAVDELDNAMDNSFDVEMTSTTQDKYAV
jgi:hypothetical protein